MEILTRIIGDISRILVLGHPEKTAIGFVLGMSIKIILKIITASTHFYIDPVNVQAWEFGILGVALLHFSTIRFHIFQGRGGLNEREEKVLRMVNSVKNEFERQQYYEKLIEMMIENGTIGNLPDDEVKFKNAIRFRS